MVRNPIGQADLASLHIADLNGITVEQVRENCQVAIVGVLVGEQLAVDEEAEDVGKDDDGFLGGLVVLRAGDVGVDCLFCIL